MKKTILLAAAALVLVSCGGNVQKKTADTGAKQTAAVPDMHTAEISLDYKGTYTGTFPAADCPGIDMRLKLEKDGMYDLHMKYIDRNSEFDEKGRYTVKGNLLTLTPGTKDAAVSYYTIEENRLRRLDADKQPITGELADHYTLIKTK